MKYQVSISKEGDYIKVEVLQPMTSELGRQSGIDAARLGNERIIKNFLFDVRKAPNVQSIVHDYYFVYEEMDALGFKSGSRSALLVSPNDKSHDFIETAFRNAGFNVRIFTDESSAISWLKKK